MTNPIELLEQRQLRADLPRAAADLVLRCMARDPGKRPVAAEVARGPGRRGGGRRRPRPGVHSYRPGVGRLLLGGLVLDHVRVGQLGQHRSTCHELPQLKQYLRLQEQSLVAVLPRQSRLFEVPAVVFTGLG